MVNALATPTNAVATKQANLDIVITWTNNEVYRVNYEVWHGTITGGVTTWDGVVLDTIAVDGDVATYTHTAPNTSQVHIYRVRATYGIQLSDYATTNSVQLLAAPNKPTVPALPAFANCAAIFRLSWVHNAIDSSVQTKYQWRWSTDGGTTWGAVGDKTASTNQFHDFAANTWAANDAVTLQVRTKGAYDAGSDDDASYSPWSDNLLVTFKSLPTASITTPANGAVLNESTLRVTVGFTQAEAATFVKTQLELLQGATLLETLESVNQVGIMMATPVQNGVSYTVRARVLDSNGLWSSWSSNAFTVEYLSPPAAIISLAYLPGNGWGQINLTIPVPGEGESAATTVSVTRAINGVTELVVDAYPVASTMTLLDTTPTIHGTNLYTIITISDEGAQVRVTASLVTNELRRAFLSKGSSFNEVVVFGGNLSVDESLGVASSVVQAAGRTKPIGLYGVETSVQLKVQSFVFGGFGSTLDQLRAILLMPGKACYRDASGRRVFGSVKGSVAYTKGDPDMRGNLAFTLTETDSPFPAILDSTMDNPGGELELSSDGYYLVPVGWEG